MTTEAEKLANELVGGYLEPTWLETEAAAMLRSQAAEIERLTAELKAASEYPWAALERKDALLREYLEAWPDGEPNWLPTCDQSKARHDKEQALIRNIKTELGEQT